MRCSNCGKEFSPSEATMDIWQKPYRGVSAMGLPQKVTPIYLCPDCAASRELAKRSLRRTIATLLAGIFILAGAGGLLVHLLAK
jgi:DNA-directed RNA polymerase subunit RPC12/RpoP